MRARIKLLSILTLVTALAAGILAAAPADTEAKWKSIELSEIGRYTSANGAEIAAFDPKSERLFVAAAGVVEVVDLSDPSAPSQAFILPVGATSVAVKKGILAVAVPGEDAANGHVYLYEDLSDLTETSTPVILEVGNLPDMVTFSEDGKKVLVANEGERLEAENPVGLEQDPEGSISIVDISRGIDRARVNTLDFHGFNDQRDRLLRKGVRIFPDAESVAQDLEPEYIAIDPDGKTAWATLQENNAFLVIDLRRERIEGIEPLGLKDYNRRGSGLDPSDEDGIEIGRWPVYGMYMPDGLSAFEVRGRTYILSGNEGDDREESERIKDLDLDPDKFPDAASLQEDENLGRLQVSSIDGDTDGDGDYDKLYSYGARSFSIWDVSVDQVFDSGDQLEQLGATLAPQLYNAEEGDPGSVDSRSDNKGPEPEGVTTGEIKGGVYGFIGLEEAGGGVFVYDLSDPRRPEFVQYVRSDLDVAPEGILFISTKDSPTHNPLLVLSNEVSRTIAVYEIDD
jgi:3-phytase